MNYLECRWNNPKKKKRFVRGLQLHKQKTCWRLSCDLYVILKPCEIHCRYIAAFMKLECNFTNSLVPYLKEAMSSAKRDMMSKSSSLFSHYVISLLDMYLLFLYTISTNAPSLIPPHFYIQYSTILKLQATPIALWTIYEESHSEKPEKFRLK